MHAKVHALFASSVAALRQNDVDVGQLYETAADSANIIGRCAAEFASAFAANDPMPTEALDGAKAAAIALLAGIITYERMRNAGVVA